MSKTRDTGYLANVIQVHDTGVRIMSGSEMLMAISSSGAVTITGELSGSDAANSLLLNGTGSVGFTTTGSFSTASGSASSRLTQIENVYATTGSNSFRATQSITGSLTVTGQIIAQTLNVQQVTSSIVYSSGSNVFGCDINSRQTFTGSFYQTGSVASFSNTVCAARYYASCIGIGTSTPNRLLSIQGPNESWIENITTQPTTQCWLIGQDGARKGLEIYDLNQSATRLFVSPATGYVGISNTSPSASLSFCNGTGNKIDFFNNGTARYTAQINESELRTYTTVAADIISFYAGNVVGLVNRNGKIVVSGTSTDAVFSVGDWCNRGGRLLTSNCAGWFGDGATPCSIVVTNNSATCKGNSVGFVLHNDSQTTNSWTPSLVFSRRSYSGIYNSAMATIQAQTLGCGVDANWNGGDLVFAVTPVGGYMSENLRLSANYACFNGTVCASKFWSTGDVNAAATANAKYFRDYYIGAVYSTFAQHTNPSNTTYNMFCASQGAVIYITSMHNNGRSTTIINYTNGVTGGMAYTVVNQTSAYSPANVTFSSGGNGWLNISYPYGGPTDFMAQVMGGTHQWGGSLTS